MDRLIDRGLEQLTTIVFKMGEVAEKVLAISMDGFIKRRDTSEDVRELSEILVAHTTDVEEKAFGLIAKYQPVASDLRIINSYIKVAYDFKRYGRYAWDISSIQKRMCGLKGFDPWIPEYIEEMSEKVLKIVQISVNSLKSLDMELAKTVTSTEQEVDDMYFQFLNKIVEEAQVANQYTISSVLVVRYLERIADHATYIAEAVVYIATGQKITLG